MNVIVLCERSGVVRRAFAKRGHNAWSCDLLPAEDRANTHIVGDARRVLNDYPRGYWDLCMIAHTPCTRLCNSGVRWLHEPPTKLEADHYSDDERAAYASMDREQRLAFMWDGLRSGAALFNDLWNTDRVEKVCAENPIMHKHARALIRNYRKPQIVQPNWFGDPFFKATGLYLRNLPPLIPTNMLTPPEKGTEEHKAWSAVHQARPGKARWKLRSEFFPGVADAMATQWTDYIEAREMAA